MLKQRSGIYFSWLFSLIAAGCVFAHDPDPAVDTNIGLLSSGSPIVVARLSENGAATRAGLKVDDILFSWKLPTNETGSFTAPYQLRTVIREQASSTIVTLTVVRGEQTLEIPIPGQCWQLCARPWLGADHLALYKEGQALVDKDRLSEGTSQWLSLADKLLAAKRQASAIWLYQKTLAVFGNNRDWKPMEEVFATATGITQELDPELKAQLYEQRAYLYDTAHQFQQAQASLKVALKLRQEIGPKSVSALNLLIQLGKNAMEPGDLNTADTYFRQAMAMGAELDAGIYYANALNSYGELVDQTGDRTTAENFYQQAYDIASATAPNCHVFASTLHNLGISAFRRRDFHRSKDYFERELELKQVGNTHAGHYEALHGLAAVAWNNQDYDRAAELIQTAVGLFDDDADNPYLAWLFSDTAILANHGGDLDKAEDFNRKALEILKATTPDDPALAHLLYALGDLSKKKGKDGDALVYFEMGRDHIETQVSKLVGPEDVRANFSSKYRAHYGRNIELLVEMGRFDDAFEVLESYHARVFLSMLTDREIAFKTDPPEALNKKRNNLQNQAEIYQTQLDALNFTDPGRKPILEKLQGLRADRARLIEEIKQSVDRQVECETPSPLDYAGMQEALAPGTVLLSYLVQKKRAFVFVGSPENKGFAVPLKIESAALEQKVSDFRRFLMKPKSPTAARMMARASHDLYKVLIEPVKEYVSAAQRVLIVPDGALHLLPFAALLDDQNRYLVQTTSFSVINSATVYHQLAQRHNSKKVPAQEPGDPMPTWFAFGDPLYQEKTRAPEEKKDSVWVEEVNSLDFQRSRGLVPLANSRNEVNNIGELNNHTEVYLGAEATESRAMGLLNETAELIHFACHGIYDEDYPLNSALILSTGPEGQNGYLHAWEIMDNLNLNADLVVMSSCESALGKERAGEGLLGLTQAFQYAGARSVVASLWRVSDLATAYLMEKFYANLNQGHSKSDALRFSQEALIDHTKGLDLSHPFYWAGFQLYGNWEPIEGQGKKTIISD